MTILDYIAANPDCSGAEIAAALNTPVTAINAELRRLWRDGSLTREERKTGGRFSYRVNTMPFGCGNPLTLMFNQLLKKARA
ncbi:TPA: winged helix-turn-helix domain-containing protein [Escherichia coli]|nr:winged helix-turn-helix domain-containing protein [Escherichia coli]MED9700671.1 winged helix-turn-helix domain-containing protein [Escherichia coli]HAY0227916.1 winged helix-turn-helix domain-containing protein [Escherichia coli]HEL8019906.1 winged helix-turn-helix domain-containing protein [Escherichia coli]HEL8086175.1 winged helix-turn-helix domain-containing protein [Escherichia coli]